MKKPGNELDDSLIVSALDLLQQAQDSGRAIFTTSMGLEDMVVGDLIASNQLDIELVTLDTGRLYPETYDLIERAEAFWQRKITVMFPDSARTEQYVQLHGINGFRDSIAQRQLCCQIRKVGPLNRALAGARAWVTGLRRDQSDSRNVLNPIEADEARSLRKFNPLFNWSAHDIQAYFKGRGIPTNPLHSRGFPSIGCAPCTRAVEPGEPERSGRWWWEQESNRECGLHQHRDKKPEEV
ncbi:MAG: phosphoadenylyl-sulfate reductase [Burkholderiaceae bacterium]